MTSSSRDPGTVVATLHWRVSASGKRYLAGYDDAGQQWLAYPSPRDDQSLVLSVRPLPRRSDFTDPDPRRSRSTKARAAATRPRLTKEQRQELAARKTLERLGMLEDDDLCDM